MESRRAALKIIGAIGARARFLSALTNCMASKPDTYIIWRPLRRATGPYEPRVFSSSEMNTLVKTVRYDYPAHPDARRRGRGCPPIHRSYRQRQRRTPQAYTTKV